ncbi:hypothetical protein Tcan_09521 [Toxocara canis]|uniref:Uncharacterized protein n=1 Tax=Toxocara canis TaxID=6265 RepID=A0A0B2VS38_TOXCA|nr:hypothetical protein Tcan_09521 [Toxocara canis]
MAVSVFMMLPVRYAAGYLSDKIKFISEIHKLRVFNTISVGGCALFHALLGFVPRHTPYLAVAVISLINILIGINVGGFYKCATLVAREAGYKPENMGWGDTTNLLVASLNRVRCWPNAQHYYSPSTA